MTYSADAFALRARNIFLQKMARARAVDLTGYLFPLPPFLELVIFFSFLFILFFFLFLFFVLWFCFVCFLTFLLFFRNEKIAYKKQKCVLIN